MRVRTYLVCIVVVAVLVLLNLPVPSSLHVKTASRGNMAPFQNALWFLLMRVPDTFSSVIAGGKNADEKRHMLEEIANLKHQIGGLKAFEQENENLRKQLGFSNASKHRLILCEVVARGDASGWWQTITVNRGLSDGVSSNMAVVTAEGLIGRTTQVARHDADVLLITDPICMVSCKIERTGALGIIKGGGVVVLGAPRLEMFSAMQPCDMDYVSTDQPLILGDWVVTSGLGGIFPEGLPVGRVIDVQVHSSKLYQRARVAPAAKMESLKYVFVIIDEKMDPGRR